MHLLIHFFPIALAVILSVVPASAQSECSVVVGALFPETGPAAQIGERSRQAAQLSLLNLPEAVRSRITIHYEDTAMKPSVGVTAARKLMEDSKLSLLTGFGSELVGAIANDVERKKIPGVFSTPDYRPIQGKRYLFRHWIDESEMYRAIVEQLKQKQLRNVGIVYSDIPAMTLFAEKFTSQSTSDGITVKFAENVLPTEVDFRTILAPMRAHGVQALLIFLLPPQASMAAKELRKYSKDIPAFGYINLENLHEVGAAGGALEGTIFTGPNFQAWFVSQFEERYKETPEFATGSIYDIIQILGGAVAEGKCTREEVREYFAGQKSYTGSVGAYQLVEQNDFRFHPVLKMIHGMSFQRM